MLAEIAKTEKGTEKLDQALNRMTKCNDLIVKNFMKIF